MDDLSGLDREELFDYLIEVGQNYDKKDWVEDKHLVPGCTSNIWLRVTSADPVQIECCAESLIVRGYCYLITELVNGKRKVDLETFDITSYITTNNLGVGTVQTRSNAFLNVWNTMLDRVKSYSGL